ncbi:portal protein [Escherichia coli]|uniref:portal protein n=1 Tax=Escherichia coli TaxID=562 RepID=UPI003F5EFA3F
MAEKKMTDWHRKVLCNFDNAWSATQDMRKQIIEAQRFVRVSGAQWEGSTNAGYSFDEGRFEHYPRFELNKIARECDRIIGEYRQNRISVKFRPKDDKASEALAEKMNGKFRADYQETSGGEACDNAFDDAVTGGFGCFRMCADYEDEMDPSNEQRRISLLPVYDPATCVFFDQDSKQYDRSDAMWAKDLAGELGHRAYAQGATLTAYEKAQIPPVASFDSYKTDISGRVPKGTATSLTLAAEPAHKVEAKDANDMPVDNRQGTITVSASGLQVGDAFTIAGVNSVHQITKDTTGQPQVFRVLAVSGTTVTISPKILPPDNADVASRPYANVDANAANGAAITILNKNAAPANLFWADGSVELMYGKLAFPTGQGPQVMTATTEQGATLIMSYAFDHIKGVTTARFTTLYGCSVLVPEYTGIVIAGQ